MFQQIAERIDVIGIYTKSHFVPKKFKWKERVFPVSEITLTSEIRDGLIKKRMYSVLSGKDLYRILFDRETEAWILEEIWVE